MSLSAAIQQAISQPWGWFVIVFSVIFLWKVSAWKAGIEHRLSSVEKAVENLARTMDELTKRVDALYRTTDALSKRVDELSKTTDALSRTMDTLSRRMDELSQKMDVVYGVIVKRPSHPVELSDSPRKLTEYGEDLCNKMDANKIVEIYADRLFKETSGMNTFQIQNRCFQFCTEELPADLEKNDKDKFDKMSMVAFEAGIDMYKVGRILGLTLRDRVFSMQDPPIVVPPRSSSVEEEIT